MMAWGAYADGFAPETAQEYAIKVAFLDGYQDAEDALTAALRKVLEAGKPLSEYGTRYPRYMRAEWDQAAAEAEEVLK
jgi:hypothetical protein